MENNITKLKNVIGSYFSNVNIDDKPINLIIEELDSYLKSASLENVEDVKEYKCKDEKMLYVLNVFEENYAEQESEITLVIPSRDAANVVNAINALGHHDFNIIVALNNTKFDFEKKFILENCKFKKPTVVEHVFSNGVKFSFSEVCNKTVEKYVSTKYVVFFNDDLECDSSVVTRLSAYAKYDVVGAVAPALTWPNGVVQNAGIFGGVHRNNLPGLYGRGMNYVDINKSPLACDAVSGACLMIRTDLFRQLNGFDENNFAIAYNDVDLGYRLNEHAYTTISMNHIYASHIEGASRGTGIGNDNPDEEVGISERYKQFVDKVVPKRFPLLLDPESSDFLRSEQHDSLKFKNKNVVVFTHNMKLEGASKIAYDVAETLYQSGFKVSILALEGGEHHSAFNKISDNIKICSWDLFSNKVIQAQVLDWMLDGDISLAICNTVICSAALYPITQKAQCKQINYIHESESFDHHLEHFGHYWVMQSALSIANNFNVFVSKYTVNVYRGLLNNKNWTVLYNYHVSSEITSSDNCDDEGYRFVTVGSVCERKNQKMVFDAMEFFEERKIKASFTVVGARNDQYHHDMKEELKVRKCEFATLNLVDETPDVDYYYNKSDIFISFSNMESFPITLLEASSNGLALMSTSVFGAKEMVVENVNGFLFEPKNVDSLHKSLSQLVNTDIASLKVSSGKLLHLWPDRNDYQQNLSRLLCM